MLAQPSVRPSDSSNSTPTISVVMGVYNGGEEIEPTVLSILDQTFEDFEFIIVNDGSTDNSLKQLRALAERDSRIQVIDQPNTGLTVALANGCKSARGPFIARQDLGDRSLPRRFEKQLAMLKSDPTVVAIDTAIRRIGPQDEPLGVASAGLAPVEFTQRFRDEGIGLVHPAAMFRKDIYHTVGGYRKEFRFAQDQDLWNRMVRHGNLGQCAEVLFELRIEMKGISATQFRVQQRLGEIAGKLGQLSTEQEPESKPLLAQADEISREAARKKSPTPQDVVAKATREAEAAYFIGSQLLQQRDARCRSYFRHSLQIRRWRWRTWAKWLLSFTLAK